MIDVFQNDAFRFFLLFNMLVALGMYVVYSTGQLSLGQAGFAAVGAYAGSYVDVKLGWPLVPVLLAAAAAAALVAIPVAFGANRVRGLYLLMGTLAVTEVVRVSLSNLDAVGGIQGIHGMEPSGVLEMAVVLALAIVGVAWLMSSPLGLEMRAIFDDEDAAAAAGVSTRTVKIIAVVAGAALTGIAGALFARYLSFIRPDLFGIGLSFSIALYVLIGGVHSLAGPLVGAFLITYLLEVLNRMQQFGLPPVLDFASPWRFAIYGGLVMAVMAVRPEGLLTRGAVRSLQAPLRRRLRRLRTSAHAAAIPARRWTAGEGSALEVVGVGHRFGGLVALEDVAFTIRPAEIVALLGANGAGKTTLINVVAGRLPLQRGSLRLARTSLGRLPAHRRTRLGVSRTFQSVRVFGHLTVGENVRLGLRAARDRARLPLEWLIELAGAPPEALARDLTLVGQRRVEIARAVASSPLVLLLDEPSAGMNERERGELAQLIRALRDLGIAVVLVDHNVDLALGIADRIVVLDFGLVIAEGVPDAIRRDERVRAAYLGTMGRSA